MHSLRKELFMTEVNKLSGTTSASQLAQKLDAADGKQDGKIEASIWNEFVADKGGKQIQNHITVNNAVKSITTYVARESKKLGKAANDLANEWLTGKTGGAAEVKDTAEAAEPKVYGSPNDPIPESELLEMVEKGELKKGDILYCYQTSCGNSKAKVIMTSDKDWKQEPIEETAENTAKTAEPNVYGSPNDTIPESTFLEMVEKGELKKGDIIYAHQTSCGNSKGKITMTSDKEWKEEPIE